MQTIHFIAKLELDALITLPYEASNKLPSRGMNMAEGLVNGTHFRVLLQPDGQLSHWFRLDKILLKAASVKIGDKVSLEIALIKEWPEPKVTSDITKALAADPQAQAAWEDITPMARWDWLNWMDAVKLAQTRKERPAKLCSMLKAGKRRPCCFNRAAQMPPRSASLL